MFFFSPPAIIDRSSLIANFGMQGGSKKKAE